MRAFPRGKKIASAKALGQVPTCIACSGNRNEATVAGGGGKEGQRRELRNIEGQTI